MINKKKLVPALVAILLMIVMPQAIADSPLPAKVQALMQSDDAVALGEAIDEALAKTPDDFALQFLKSLSLMDRARLTEALTHQDAMIAKFPGVAVLHNNRGVGRAQMRQYSQAIQDFEEAVRLDPGYAIASENLGMVYAALADMALSSAMKLDQGNTRIGKRQGLARSLVEDRVVGIAPTPAAGAVTPLPITPTVAVQPQVKPSAVVLSVGPAKSAEKPEVAEKPALKPDTPAASELALPPSIESTAAANMPAAGKTPEPPPITPPAPPVAEPPPPPPVSPQPPAASLAAEANQASAILQAMEAWRSAWSKKDMAAYFAAYSPTFTPHPSLKDQAAWRLDREKKIAQRSGEIKISIDNPIIVFRPDGTAELKLEQQYQTDDFSESIRKLFVLSNQGGRWLIEVEKNLILRVAPK